MKLPIIIAEAGNNHEGILDVAMELIDKAKQCGADLVKFQAGTAEGFARSEDDIPRYKKYELGLNGYKTLIKKGESIGIPVFFSVWSEEFAEFRHLEWFKLASRQCSQRNINKYETDKTFISVPHNYVGSLNIRKGIPMHCVTEYPANFAYLNRLVFLSKYFARNVGYSDHTMGIDNCIEAAKLGAVAIEKHFTLAHNFGPLRDHQLSATPEEMKRLVEEVKK